MGQSPRLKLLLAGLLATLLLATPAAAFTDTQGHPSETAIDKWSAEYGVLSAYEDGSFRPDGSVTKGEFAGILDRVMRFRRQSDPSAFRDIQGSRWADAILKLHAHAIMAGTDKLAEPDAAVTRQQAVAMVARAFELVADSTSPHYADDADIEGYARSAVSGMAELGYLEGVADEYFRPNQPISRADVLRILDNVISVMVFTETPLTRNVDGNVLVSSVGGATLRNIYVTGDLYIAYGVTGTVVLDNVTIGGQTRNLSRAAAVEVRASSAPPPLPAQGEETVVQPIANPEQAADSGVTYDPGETTAPRPASPAKPADSGKTSIDPGETTAPKAAAADSDEALYAPERAVDSGAAPSNSGATPDSGQSADSGATPDSGATAASRRKASGTFGSKAATRAKTSDSGATADSGATPDSGQTADSGATPDSGATAASRRRASGTFGSKAVGKAKTSDSGVTYDPGETVSPSDSGKTTDSGATENPENQVPINTPTPATTTPAVPDNPENQLPDYTPYVPVNKDYGTLPNKPVSQLTIGDVYAPGKTTGQYFTFEGRRIPIYQGVPARRVYSGEFVWRAGHRLRYIGNRYDAWFGVDVSAYQNRDRSNGTINWAAAKADGVQFAMVRVGLRGTSTGILHEDAYYARNIDGAMAQGIQTGAYIFAQARTIAEAIEEADFVIARLRGHKINGPVSYDWEMKDSSYRVYGVSPEMATACAVAFCKRVAAAGYTPMVYNSRYVAYVKYDQGALAPYMMWYPQYPASSTPAPYPNLYYQMDYWQFTDSAVVEGIGRKIDANIWFRPKS